MPTLISRARLEMGDTGHSVAAEFQGDDLTTVLTLMQKPLQPTTVVVQVDTTSLTPDVDYTVNAEEGTVTLRDPAPAGHVVTVNATAFRYFTDDNWTYFFTTALDQHLHNRVDELQQPVELTTLPEIEEYPVVLLAIVQALYALLNDASFDIDISTPEGVHIPRGQRVEQLWHMVTSRQQRYNEICLALNVGLWRVEQFDLRRKSYMTGRLVPVYQAQEIQDNRFPRQIFPEIPTDGATPEPVPTFEQEINLTAYSNQEFTRTITLGYDITGLQVRGSVRRYPYSLTPLVYMDVTVLNASTGQVQVHVNARLNYYIGVSKFWDVQTIDSSGNVTTRVGGTYDAIRQGGY